MPTSTLPIRVWCKPESKFVLLAPGNKPAHDPWLPVPVRCIIRDELTNAPDISSPLPGTASSTPVSVASPQPGDSLPAHAQEPYVRPREIRNAVAIHHEDKQRELMTALEAILAHRWPYLGGGVYGSTYSSGPDWAIKVSRNDGTRQYLEWCHALQQQGKALPGMPKIEFIASITNRVYYSGVVVDNYYVVGMRRYRPARGRLREFGFKVYDQYQPNLDCMPHLLPAAERKPGQDMFFEPVYNLHQQPGCPDYIKELVATADAVFGEGFANDCHSGNLMIDTQENRLVLTDPSSRAYPFLEARHWPVYFELRPPL